MHAGGSFAYLRVELGDFMAFIAAGNILLEYCIGGAAVARSWTSYFATLLDHHPNDFRVHAPALSEDYSRLDPIAVAVVLLAKHYHAGLPNSLPNGCQVGGVAKSRVNGHNGLGMLLYVGLNGPEGGLGPRRGS